MTLPTELVDLEKQKFADASDVPVVRIVNSSGSETASQTTVSALSGKLPATLGQKAMAASMSVAPSSNQSDVALNAFSTAVSPRKCFNLSVSTTVTATSTEDYPLESDAFAVVGPSSGTIYITKVTMSAAHTAAIITVIPMSLIKRTSANTCASVATVNAVANLPTDTTTAYGEVYEVSPSVLGSSAGTMFLRIHQIPSSTGRAPRFVWSASEFNKPIALTTGEFLCLNFTLVEELEFTTTIAINVEFFHIT
jgi:hypothetical protein